MDRTDRLFFRFRRYYNEKMAPGPSPSLVESFVFFLNDSGLSTEMIRELKSMKPLSEDLT